MLGAACGFPGALDRGTFCQRRTGLAGHIGILAMANFAIAKYVLSRAGYGGPFRSSSSIQGALRRVLDSMPTKRSRLHVGIQHTPTIRLRLDPLAGGLRSRTPTQRTKPTARPAAKPARPKPAKRPQRLGSCRRSDPCARTAASLTQTQLAERLKTSGQYRPSRARPDAGDDPDAALCRRRDRAQPHLSISGRFRGPASVGEKPSHSGGTQWSSPWERRSYGGSER